MISDYCPKSGYDSTKERACKGGVRRTFGADKRMKYHGFEAASLPPTGAFGAPLFRGAIRESLQPADRG